MVNKFQLSVFRCFFGGKNMRRRNLFALPALLFLYSCGIVEIGEDQEGNAGGVWGGPAGGAGT